MHFDNDNWGAESNNFISIGGPFVNEIPKYILDRNLVPNFLITDIPTAIDDGIEYKAEREGTATSPERRFRLTMDSSLLRKTHGIFPSKIENDCV